MVATALLHLPVSIKLENYEGKPKRLPRGILIGDRTDLQDVIVPLDRAVVIYQAEMKKEDKLDADRDAAVHYREKSIKMTAWTLTNKSKPSINWDRNWLPRQCQHNLTFCREPANSFGHTCRISANVRWEYKPNHHVQTPQELTSLDVHLVNSAPIALEGKLAS